MTLAETIRMAKTKQSTSRPEDLRETLFGDMAIATWGADQSDAPWSHFATATTCLERGDQAGAVAALQTVVETENLASRHYLQAWQALRQAGVSPSPTEGKHVLGVVVDVPVGPGVDTLAAYEDGTARYLNHAGSVVVWEAPDDRMAALVANLIAEGQTLAMRIGPWAEARPALPAGLARLSMLTPSGLHFGQAPFDQLAREPMAAPLVDAATRLMQALVEVATTNRS